MAVDAHVLRLLHGMRLLLRRIEQTETHLKGMHSPYRGTWKPGTEARRGELWTRSGSLWHADKDTTTTPGKDPACWTLAVKRGHADRHEGP